MKRIILAGILVFGAAMAMAQDINIDAVIKNAVDKLAEGQTGTRELSIAPLTVKGTELVTALSSYLNDKIRLYASNCAAFKVAEETKTFEPSPPDRVMMTGSYTLSGFGGWNWNVKAELKLVRELDGVKLNGTEFEIPLAGLKKMGIEVLPANIKTQKQAEKDENLFAEAPSNDAFALKIFGNSDSRTYYDKDNLELTLLADKDCFFKVYHIDVDNNIKLIYPNSHDQDNKLTANKARTIPESTEFRMEAPFGVESILVVASETPFKNIESGAEVKISKEALAAATDSERGLNFKPSAGAALTVNARYSYTVLERKPNIEILSYGKGSDFADSLAAIKSEIINGGNGGGTFSGDERSGTFSQNGLSGSYTVSGTVITFTFDEAPAETGLVRGMKNIFTFSFPKPDDISRAVLTVKNEITKNKGAFTGDENEGSFAVQGIAGAYQVFENVNVSIYDKPWIIPNSLIEKEVKNYFLRN